MIMKPLLRRHLPLLVSLAMLPGAAFAELSAVPDSLDITRDQKATIQLFGVEGRIRIRTSDESVIQAKLRGSEIRVEAGEIGTAVIRVRDGESSISIPVAVRSDEGGGGGGDGGDGGGGGGDSYTLLGWNDLGMHCMDADYSVFSILPPFNNLRAQLIDRNGNGVVSDGVTVTFEAMTDPDGSINSFSVGKTNFWDYVADFFGVTPPAGEGLAGFRSAETTPQVMNLDAAAGMFVADGIPITPYDDTLAKNFYPMVRVAAHDGNGNLLAEARVVLPVSDEMTCIGCHGSGSGDDARPDSGWLNDPDPERDYRRNILNLHDQEQGAKPAYQSALATLGYSPAGLLATADGGRAILCASCHGSNALPGSGVAGISPLTEAMHSQHDTALDPLTGQALGDSDNRSACYQCHPGSETRCLRGVMGNALNDDGTLAMQCQNCHGQMADVGREGRVGWLEQPNCQSCHHDGQRETDALTADGLLKTWADERYATNADVPAAGFDLYRFSKGHGDLQCEACHGATHAEYPSSHVNDNLLALDVQGREGSIGECTACHQNVPDTTDGGPHGMHTVGSRWVDRHENVAEDNHQQCAYCHGADYRGGPLSEVKVARSFSAEGRQVSYQPGQQVGCYDCHDGPTGD